MTRPNPVADHGPWSLGTLVAFPIGVLIVVIGLGVTAYALASIRHSDRGSIAHGDARFTAGGGVIVAVVAFGLTAYGMFPYDSGYHQWRPVNGSVDRIDKRLVKDGDGMSERFVVTIGGRPFAVDDTRAATLDVGDPVALSCKREWQYAAVSGWACRWAEATR